MKKQSVTLPSLLILTFSIIYYSCNKKKTNEKLYNESKETNLIFYKGKDTIYEAKGGSPHGNFKLKFNSIALQSLGNNAKLPPGESFAEGSLIVKEAYSGNSLTLYAVMKKDSKSKYASSKWVWGEYGPDGKVIYSVSKEGNACTSCHSTSPNRDLVRTFDLH